MDGSVVVVRLDLATYRSRERSVVVVRGPYLEYLIYDPVYKRDYSVYPIESSNRVPYE